MAVSLDVWGCVAGYCDAGELGTLQAVCRWMANEMGKDKYWGKVLGCRFGGVEGIVGCQAVFKRIVFGCVQEAVVKIVKNSGIEYSYDFRCENMLDSSGGVFCTAPGICSAVVECQPAIPFLLTEIHAKGAGRGFSSPLKKFAVDGESYTLTEPAEHHVFMPTKPFVINGPMRVELLEGTKKDENIDTEYIGFHGVLLDSIKVEE